MKTNDKKWKKLNLTMFSKEGGRTEELWAGGKWSSWGEAGGVVKSIVCAEAVGELLVLLLEGAKLGKGWGSLSNTSSTREGLQG